MNCDDPVATIYYTLDGSGPTTASPVYAGPIDISTDTTLKLIAVDVCGNQSGTVTEIYDIDSEPPTGLIATPAGGSFCATPVTVNLSASDGTIYYTTDGSGPTTASPVYTVPIDISVDTTLKFMAVDTCGNQAGTVTEIYDIDTSAPGSLTASPPGGSVCLDTSVTLSCDDPVATIYYTLDGTGPTTASPVYAEPIDISMDTTLKFMAVNTCGYQSGTVTETYTIDTTAPSSLAASPSGGSYCPTSVTLSCDDPGATIYYTTDGSRPNPPDGNVYTGPIYISEYTVLKFMAEDDCGNQSGTETEFYDIDLEAPAGLTATPAGGSYCATTVSLSASDGTIYYTLDGSGPNTGSLVYSVPIDVSVDTTLKFMAVDACSHQSSTVTEAYDIDTEAVVSITSPADGVTVFAGDIWVSGTANTDITTVTVTSDQGHSESSPVYAGGNWSVVLTGVTLPSIVINASGTDNCGNTGSDSITIFVYGEPAIWYVNDDATGAGTGLSWTDAFTVIQDAADAAASGDWIWVAEGTYTNSIASTSSVLTMKAGVEIYGGFTGTESNLFERGDPADHPAIFDGENMSYHVVVGTSNARLDGFIVTGGNADGSGFDDNGGGLYNESATNLMVANCTFSNNSAYWSGGGIYNYKSSPIITNCIFSNNSVRYGGGISNEDNSSPTIINCTFIGNSAIDAGGGIDNYYNSSPTIINCSFSGNSATYGGGTNNENNSLPTITNCILWNDSPDEIYTDASSSPIVAYSDIDGGYAGTGNIGFDPQFVGYPDLRLQHRRSPCVDTGTADGAPSYDLDGNLRPILEGYDMGAYEHYPVPNWFVNDDATGTETGLSWENAFTNVQEAMDAASWGEVIFVAEGTYTNSPTSTSAVLYMQYDIYGGFVGTESNYLERGDPAAYPTVLDGEDTSYHVVIGASNVRLDGFIITGGNANGGGLNDYGGGMFNWNSSPTITNCIFSNNTARYGGGMYNNNCSPTIINCIFSGNSTTIFGYGGGMFNEYNSSPTITNCIFSDNSADVSGGGITNWDSSSPTIINCIMWSNFNGSIYNDLTSNPIVAYSDIQWGYPGTGNIDADPQFVSGPNGDYYLSQTAAGQGSDSPCVDAGSDTAVNLRMGNKTTRTDGVPDSGIVDMGYHYLDIIPPGNLAASPAGGSYCPTSVTLSCDDPGATIYYTTDGSNPTTASPVYTGPIDISMDTTLKFMAKDASGNQSGTVTEVYDIDDEPPTGLAASPAGGSYCVTTVTLSAVGATTIYYTTDGSGPTTASPIYTVPIDISGDTMLKFIAVDTCGNQAGTVTEVYTIDNTAPNPPTITSPADGAAINSSTVPTDINCAEGSCEQRLDGGIWTPSCAVTFSGLTQGPHTIEATCTDTCNNVSVVETSTFWVDTQSPWVMFTNPDDGQTGVPTGVNIEIRFNEDMAKGSVESGFTLSTGTGAPLTGGFYWTSDDTVTFATPDLLTDYTTYTVDLAGAIDLAGNPLMPGSFPFDFETGDCTPPQVTSRDPDGTTLVDSSTLTQITLWFNEPMDTTRGRMEIRNIFGQTVVQAEVGGSSFGGTLTWTAGDTLTLTLGTPSPIQEGGGYRINTWDLNDLNWNGVWGDVRWSIVAQGPASDITAPQIVFSLPFDGQTGVPRKLYDFARNSIMLGFDEPLDPSTIILTNITLTNSSGPVPFDLNWSVGDGPSPFSIILTPDLPLNQLETYNIGISGGIEDSVGNSFIPQSISFTTADEPDDTTPPQVEATLPGDGWIDLSWWGVDGEIGFNEPIDCSTVDISALTMMETDTGIPIKGFNFEKQDDGEAGTWSLDFWSTQAFTGMKPATQYTLTVIGIIEDISANPLADYSWTFTTVPEGPITGQPDNRTPRIWNVWPNLNASSFENGNVTIALEIGVWDDDGDSLTIWAEDDYANSWTLTENFPGSDEYSYQTAVVGDLDSGNEPLITYDGWQTFTFYIDDGYGHTISVSNQVYIWPTADLPNQVSPIYGEGVTSGGPTTLVWQNVDTTNAVLLVGQYFNMGTGGNGMFFTLPAFTQATLTGLTPGNYMWMVVQMAEVHGRIFDQGGMGYGYQGVGVSNYNVVDPGLGSISGTISYAGASTGAIIVEGYTNSSFSGAPVASTMIPGPGSYTLYNLPDDTYYLLSFMDVNGNMQLDAMEPTGMYGAPDPVTIFGGSSETGIDIILIDPT
ncbi:MAG: chitobiase/beta-hexosaminidase C-terminal domain-containing protein [Deltaproteobacteria bacterium]|nr:MAG: chitobiase/beta-hexosaminidase C-terminal domain-containing protein [Deltaproteobacteria bacterium]